MLTKDFSFDLPEELIAQYPTSRRRDSRLMVIDPASQTWRHQKLLDLPEFLDSQVVMVFNNSRVRKARVMAKLSTGARVEILFQRQLSGQHWLCMTTKSKRLIPGTVVYFSEDLKAVVTSEEEGGLKVLEPSFTIDEAFFETWGQIPLPPYIKREDTAFDGERYQTVYSQSMGSVAAPTAGLHFDEEFLKTLESRGISQEFVTLHVGLGTFLPVRSLKVEDHKMHEEHYSLSPETAERLNQARSSGKSILAVGTTSLRTLESNFQDGQFHSGDFATKIFIYPGYQFQCVDALFTNFHTPESTLLMLVSAFGGTDLVKRAYADAVTQKYRFFSYGDACLFLKKNQ